MFRAGFDRRFFGSLSKIGVKIQVANVSWAISRRRENVVAAAAAAVIRSEEKVL